MAFGAFYKGIIIIITSHCEFSGREYLYIHIIGKKMELTEIVRNKMKFFNILTKNSVNVTPIRV